MRRSRHAATAVQTGIVSMESKLEDTLALYDYTLPPELIANAPAHPRDSAKLLVFDRTKKNHADAIFRDIGDFLPKNALLVLNDTKVIPARLPVKRATGGIVKLLILDAKPDAIHTLSPKILKPGEVLSIGDDATLTVIDRNNDDHWLLKPEFPMTQWHAILDKYGETPLPPYIKDCPLNETERRREYQTVFAKSEGSIAAPTASLHFTPELLTNLRHQGIETATVTLHVHLGTFAPLTEEQWNNGTLHHETFVIHPDQSAIIAKAIKDRRPVIAVGTTALRTLESAFDAKGNLIKVSGETDLFIREGYAFNVVTGLITNFHVPRSSLLMLVAAFVGREDILALYRHAMEERYRFYSFGDAMLIL